MKYVVKKRNKSYDVLELDYPIKGYKFNSKNNVVKTITLVNFKFANKVVNIKLNTMLTKVMMLVNSAFESDEDDGGVLIALDEIQMVKNAIKNKYNKYLKEEQEFIYLKKLSLLEDEMKEKLFFKQITKVSKVEEVEENKGKSR